MGNYDLNPPTSSIFWKKPKIHPKRDLIILFRSQENCGLKGKLRLKSTNFIYILEKNQNPPQKGFNNII
jgi:hypothetical protein